MNSSKLLKGKVCLVTGTSRGIGRAIAERYAQEGAIVYANARKSGEIDEWAADCAKTYQTTVKPVYFDVRESAAVKEAVLQIKKENSCFDVLVNNAGVVSYELMGMVDTNKLREMYDINVSAAMHLIQLVSRLMARRGAGSIINISSVVATKGVGGQVAYAATKGAIISLTKSAAKELAPHKIRVNAVAPGIINTERLRHEMKDRFEDVIARIGMGRMGEPSDVADVCVFLASNLSSYVTGQIIEVDGALML